MGLFSFVASAGGKLGSSVYDMLNKDEDITKPTTISPERMNELRKRNIELGIREEFGDVVNDVTVAVNGEVVTLSGTIVNQSSCEKVILSAGNRHGIARVDCQLIVNEPESEAEFYTVKAGDTLSKIAKHFYQNANKYPTIFEANKPMLSHPDKIYPGQVLRIPT